MARQGKHHRQGVFGGGHRVSPPGVFMTSKPARARRFDLDVVHSVPAGRFTLSRTHSRSCPLSTWCGCARSWHRIRAKRPLFPPRSMIGRVHPSARGRAAARGRSHPSVANKNIECAHLSTPGKLSESRDWSQGLRLCLPNNLSGLQNISTMGVFQSDAGVLFDNEDGVPPSLMLLRT